MRKWADYFLLACALAAAWYQWAFNGPEIRAAWRAGKARFLPCSSPITYSVGTIDLGYSVTPEELASMLKEAEAAWEGSATRNLFEHVPSSGDVTVNMIYDNRQASFDKLKAAGLLVNRTLESYGALKTRYDSLAAEVDLKQAALHAHLADYRRKEAAHNANVARWKRRGDPPPAEVRRAKATKAALEREFAGFKKIEAAVNESIDLLNALATALNQQIVELNLNVQQYNREGSSIGMYEEGLYRVREGKRSIEIYKYADRTQLVHLLAHELGHAIGLEHVQDKAALMYPVNDGGVPKITPSDGAELDRACTPPAAEKLRGLLPGKK